MSAYIPLLVSVAGLLVYALASNPKVSEAGRIAYGRLRAPGHAVRPGRSHRALPRAVMRLAPILALALALFAGCSTLRIEPRAGQIERIEVRCSAPSRLAYRLDGELVFERVSPQALPANVRCVPPAVDIGP